MRGQAGQATLEWAGLVLIAALALGALALLWASPNGREAAREAGLGEALAAHVTCAAERSCAAGSTRRDGVAPARAAAPSLVDRTRAFRSLRGLGLIAKRTWILCLGHKRWRYELKHPRVPTEPLPVDEALRIANGCLNPVAFLGE